MALRIPNKDALAARQNHAEGPAFPGAKARCDEISEALLLASKNALFHLHPHELVTYQ